MFDTKIVPNKHRVRENTNFDKTLFWSVLLKHATKTFKWRPWQKGVFNVYAVAKSQI